MFPEIRGTIIPSIYTQKLKETQPCLTSQCREISDLLKRLHFTVVKEKSLLWSTQCLLDFLASHDSSNVRIGHLMHWQAVEQTFIG